jgi:hypothetical protein
MTCTFTILAGELEGKRSPGKPRHRREDNIKMYLKEIGYECVECILLAQY